MDPKAKEDSENLNPAQADYEDKFNNLSNAENKSPEKNSQNASDANSLNEAEKTSTGKNGFYKPSENNKSLNSIGKKGLMKKFGASGGVIGLIVCLFTIFQLIGGATGLLVHMKEVLFNWLHDADASTLIRSRKILAKKIRFEFSSEDKCNVRCKFGSVSSSTKRLFESRGTKLGFEFTFEEKSGAFGKRYVVKEIKFPDSADGTKGARVTNGKDFKLALKNTRNFANFRNIFNSKTATFLSSRFGNMLYKKFKLDKLAKVVGNTKEKAIASMRKSMGLEGETWRKGPSRSEELRKRFPRAYEAIDTVKAKGEKAKTLIGSACGVYDVSRVVTYAQKTMKIATYAGFAFLFLNMADRIKKGENPSPESVEVLANLLIDTDSDKKTESGARNANFGKSATDSTGYQIAAYKSSPGYLNEKDSVLGLGPSGGFLEFLSSSLGKVVAAIGFLGISWKILRVTCGFAYSPTFSFIAECAPDFNIGCAVRIVGGLIVSTVAFSYAINKGLQLLESKYVPIIDERTLGSDAGNIIYMGTASIMGSNSASLGMKAGDKASIKQYALDTAETRNEIVAADVLDASKTPFDPYNQYSFLGSILNNVGFYRFANSNLLGKFTTFGTIFRSSIYGLFPRSFADQNEADLRSEMFSKCQDKSLEAIGVSGDVFCNQGYVMSSEELNYEIDDVVGYMINNKHIDEDGKPMSQDYNNYIDYCVNRADPLGETGSSIADPELADLNPLTSITGAIDAARNALNDDRSEYGWQIGQYCVENSEMLSNFRTYTMDFALNETIDAYQ